MAAKDSEAPGLEAQGSAAEGLEAPGWAAPGSEAPGSEALGSAAEGSEAPGWVVGEAGQKAAVVALVGPAEGILAGHHKSHRGRYYRPPCERQQRVSQSPRAPSCMQG